MKNSVFTLFFIVILRGLLACKHEPIVVLKPELPTNPCTDSTLTYEKNIAPIFAKHCQNCHGDTRAERGIRFDFYIGATTYVGRDTSRFFCTVEHTGNCLPMPLGLPKMGDCDIQKIRTWVQNGMPK